MPFSALGLDADLAAACRLAGYLAPTQIQQQAIPAILHGHDLQACARTGSGKSAAFCLPLLQRWAHAPQQSPRCAPALLLVPTRELAQQLAATLAALAAPMARQPRICALYGGVSINPQMMALRGGADFIVATPGRLLDLAGRNAVKLAATHTLVLDEADRLLELGFADEMGHILALLPQQRQNLLFSATFPPTVTALADALLTQPVRIAGAADADAAPAIRQRAIAVDEAQRSRLLLQLICEQRWPQLLVFVASQHGAERLADKLGRAGIAAAALHGAASQGARTRALADFKQHKLQVLVATDLAARGIDIAALPLVVNYDLPRAAADYTHRIGRTGRAGASGLAISFVPIRAEAHFRLIEKQQKQRVAREEIAGFEPVDTLPAATAAAGSGGIKGKRKSKKDKLREAAAEGGKAS